MDVSATSSDAAGAIQMALQSKMLESIKTQGAGIAQLIASASMPSVNSPSQGHHVDAFA